MEGIEPGSAYSLFSSMLKQDKLKNVKFQKIDKLKLKTAQQENLVLLVDLQGTQCHNYGDLPLVQSVAPNDKEYTEFGALSSSVGKILWLRGRVHNARIKGNMGFLILRDRMCTVQCLLLKSEEISKEMIKYAGCVPNESVIDVLGVVKQPEQAISSCSISDVEIMVQAFYVVNRGNNKLPFQLEDANQPISLEEAENEGKDIIEDAVRGKVSQKVRLDHRVLDLRVPVSQAVLRVSSGVCQYFREFLTQDGFVEIHTPKIIPGVSEGGTEVFKLEYFGRTACLAQSPQLYKQMAVMGDLDKVFEIGPVFRAENSNTHRHLCEFIGMDIEMRIKAHYMELLELLHRLFSYIFKSLNEHFAAELGVVQRHFPFITPFEFTEQPVILTFREAIEMLDHADWRDEKGNRQLVNQDFSTECEKFLGKLVKQKYGTDFYVVHRYPQEARPFYTMLAPDDPNFTNSFDVFMRGEEIISGAQRIHEPNMLYARAIYKGIDPRPLKDYIDSFKYGAYPHGGCGIGLERVVMLFTGIKNVKYVSLFTRDPKRLTP